MALDSVAAFLERVQELELTQHLDRFKAAKWNTLAALAFSSPQGGNEEAFIKNVLVPGLGSADHADTHLLRRLYFESFMLASADLKRRADSTADDAPRRMPAPERRERFKRVEDRLTLGTLMRDDFEVPHTS